MQTTVSGTTTLTVSIGSLEEVQTTGSTTTTTTYYTVQGKRIAGKVNGSLYSFGYDALGSQVVVLNSSGNLVGSQLYGPYGNSRYSNGTLPTSIGFTGQRADSVTGLDYYVARYYDPVVGQFLSADTVQGNAQGMDPYAYVGGNPETKTDPTGERAAGCIPGQQGCDPNGTTGTFQCNPTCEAPPSGNGGGGGTSCRSNPGCATDMGDCQENVYACTNGPSPTAPPQKATPITTCRTVLCSYKHNPNPAHVPGSETNGMEYDETYIFPDNPAPDPKALLKMLIDNFNKYFPFPSGCGTLVVGEICVLKAFAFFDAPVKVVAITATSFTLISLPGHPEGANRLITFSFGRTTDGQTYLDVWSRGPGSWGAFGTIATGLDYEIWAYLFSNLDVGVEDGDINKY